MRLSLIQPLFSPPDAPGVGGGDPSPVAPGAEARPGGDSPIDSGPDTSVEEVGTDFMQLGALDGDEDPPAPAEVQPPVPPAKPVAKAPVQEAQPPVPESKPPVTPEDPKQPQPQQQAPAQAQPEQQPPAPQQAATTPKGLAEQLETHRAALLDSLAAQHFQISKEEADALITDPASVLPKLGARVYYQAMQSALLHMEQFVPRMVQQITRDMRAHDEAEAGFYSTHKALDKAKHGKDVRQFAAAFRQTNPQIKQEDLLAMVASAVMAKYGLSALPAQGNGHQPPQAQQMPPYVPASPGGGGQVSRTQVQDENPFLGLGQAYDDD